MLNSLTGATAEWSLSQTAASFIQRSIAGGTSGSQNYSRTKVVRQRLMTAPSSLESDSNQKWLFYGFVTLIALISMPSFDLIALHMTPFLKKSDNCPFRSVVNKCFASNLDVTVNWTADEWRSALPDQVHLISFRLTARSFAREISGGWSVGSPWRRPLIDAKWTDQGNVPVTTNDHAARHYQRGSRTFFTRTSNLPSRCNRAPLTDANEGRLLRQRTGIFLVDTSFSPYPGDANQPQTILFIFF